MYLEPVLSGGTDLPDSLHSSNGSLDWLEVHYLFTNRLSPLNILEKTEFSNSVFSHTLQN